MFMFMFIFLRRCFLVRTGKTLSFLISRPQFTKCGETWLGWLGHSSPCGDNGNTKKALPEPSRAWAVSLGGGAQTRGNGVRGGRQIVWSWRPPSDSISAAMIDSLIQLADGVLTAIALVHGFFIIASLLARS